MRSIRAPASPGTRSPPKECTMLCNVVSFREVCVKCDSLTPSYCELLKESPCPNPRVKLALPAIQKVYPDVRMTGKPEITKERAGVAKKWQVGGLRAECLSQFSLSNLWDTIVAMSVCGTPEREHFRTINVQWIGQWGPFSRCGTSWNQ